MLPLERYTSVRRYVLYIRREPRNHFVTPSSNTCDVTLKFYGNLFDYWESVVRKAS